MKLTISQSELQNALAIVQKGITNRSTLPILSGIYVETRGDEVNFQSMDIKLSVQYTIPALVEEEGKAVLPGKLTLDIVKNLPDAAVHLEVKDNEALILCESSSFSIKGLDPQDFPGFPTIEPQRQISVPFDLFSNMARKVCRVVSRDESRPILTGVLVAFEDSKFKMVATDSYRLALAEAAVETTADDFSAVIAGSFISDLASLPKTGGDITIAIDDSQIIASYSNIVFVNPRIEGKYPNYKQLLPATCETRCIIDRATLLSGVKRASLLDHSASQVKFDVNVATQTIQLSAVTQDIGSIQEMMKAEIEGADIEIGFNSNFVMEGLSVMDADQVSFEMVSATKPGVFKGYPDEGYLYLVMPVRL